MKFSNLTFLSLSAFLGLILTSCIFDNEDSDKADDLQNQAIIDSTRIQKNDSIIFEAKDTIKSPILLPTYKELFEKGFYTFEIEDHAEYNILRLNSFSNQDSSKTPLDPKLRPKYRYYEETREQYSGDRYDFHYKFPLTSNISDAQTIAPFNIMSYDNKGNIVYHIDQTTRSISTLVSLEGKGIGNLSPYPSKFVDFKFTEGAQTYNLKITYPVQAYISQTDECLSQMIFERSFYGYCINEFQVIAKQGNSIASGEHHSEIWGFEYYPLDSLNQVLTHTEFIWLPSFRVGAQLHQDGSVSFNDSTNVIKGTWKEEVFQGQTIYVINGPKELKHTDAPNHLSFIVEKDNRLLTGTLIREEYSIETPSNYYNQAALEQLTEYFSQFEK